MTHEMKRVQEIAARLYRQTKRAENNSNPEAAKLALGLYADARAVTWIIDQVAELEAMVAGMESTINRLCRS